MFSSKLPTSSSIKSQQSSKYVSSSKCLQYLNMGNPIHEEDISDAIKNYLDQCTFTRIQFFKSKLSCSISQKLVQGVHLFYDFILDKILEMTGYVMMTFIEQAVLNHVEMILQGVVCDKKGSKNVLVLLSYGSDALQFDSKTYENQEDKQRKYNQIITRRKKNFYLKSMNVKQFNGEKINEFFKIFFRKDNCQYNLLTKNCHDFVSHFIEFLTNKKFELYIEHNCQRIKGWKQWPRSIMSIIFFYVKDKVQIYKNQRNKNNDPNQPKESSEPNPSSM